MSTQSPTIQLIFWSRRSSDEPSNENHAQLRSMVRKARQANGKRDITGALMATQGGYWQVLEGPQHEVEDLLARIRKDSRHRSFIELDRRYIGERRFTGFALALIEEDKDVRAAMRRQFGSATPQPRRINEQRLVALMQQQLANESQLMELAA